MALLQLAENNLNMLAEYDGMYLTESGTVAENYLFIPAGLFGMDQDTYVRSDFFDSLSDAEFNAVITTLAPYQPQGLSAVGAVVSGAVAVGKKLAPGIQKAIDKRRQKIADGTVKPIFKPGGPLSNLASKVKGGIDKLKNVVSTRQDELIEKTTPVTGSVDIGGTQIDFATGSENLTPTNFITKYKTPLLIGGVAIAGLLLYKTLKK